MSEGLQRDIGRHDEAIETLKNDVSEIKKDIAEIKALLSETKGGMRALLGAASIGGAVGAAIMKAFAMLKGGG